MAKIKKERELTKEEALNQAREQMKPYWFFTSPLFAPTILPTPTGGDTTAIFALEPDFNAKNWLLFFADPTLFSADILPLFIKEWNRRYINNNINSLIIISFPFKNFQASRYVDEWLKRWQIRLPTVLDFDFQIRESYNVPK